MSKERFLFLLSCIPFHDSETRDDIKSSGDKLTAISEIFNKFILNVRANYTPSKFLTVDETLVGFCGRCFFRMYIEGKPQNMTSK